MRGVFFRLLFFVAVRQCQVNSAVAILLKMPLYYIYFFAGSLVHPPKNRNSAFASPCQDGASDESCAACRRGESAPVRAVFFVAVRKRQVNSAVAILLEMTLY